jgi:3-dehydroquinate dehydratase type I
MKHSLCGCLMDAPLSELAQALSCRELDLLEWRIDSTLASHTPQETLQALSILREPHRIPVLATNRPTREGGLYAGDEEDRLAILEKAVESGAEWVDLELDVPSEVLTRFASLGARVLLSHHDFSGTPDVERLRAWAKEMSERGTQAIKIVTRAQEPEDNLRVLGLIPWARRELGRPLIAFCMGGAGRWSRLACLFLGSPWTYVQMPGRSSAAPGQLTLEEMRQLLLLFADDGPVPHETGTNPLVAGDMSQHKNMVERLQQADKLASIGQLASGIAHEINNPLSLILGYTQLLLRDEKEDSERGKDLRIIEKHARACKTIVRDLLSFARGTPSKKGSAQLHTCIQEVLGVVQHQFELDGVKIQTSLDPAVPPMRLDDARIKQVFMNLIMNAKQAIRDKGMIHVFTQYDRPGGTVTLRVRDTGCGIQPEHLSRIFDPFFTTKGTGEGTGLGLSVSYGIVKDHGGEITVESEPGVGSTFSMALPVAENEREPP